MLNISDLLTPLVSPAYGLERQGMALLESPDFKISPDPPRGSRLPAFGPLFTNFLDPPLNRSAVCLFAMHTLLPWNIDAIS